MQRRIVYLTLFLVGAALVLSSTDVLYADQTGATYVGNSKCKVCHNSKTGGEIWNVWKAEQHSKAYATLQSEESKAVAQRVGLATPPAESPECLKCHVTTYSADTKKTADGIALEDGVQCESCHGPASLHVEDGKKKKKGENVDISAHQTRPDVKACVVCHNDQSPTWNPERYTLADGTKSGFDFAQAWAKIKHEIPEGAK